MVYLCLPVPQILICALSSFFFVRSGVVFDLEDASANVSQNSDDPNLFDASLFFRLSHDDLSVNESASAANDSAGGPRPLLTAGGDAAELEFFCKVVLGGEEAEDDRLRAVRSTVYYLSEADAEPEGELPAICQHLTLSNKKQQ